MKVLESLPPFSAWFGRSWHKKELLDRRHRADCDPFIDIANVLDKPVAATLITRDAVSRAPRKQLLTPDRVDIMWKQVLTKAGNDQLLVSRPLFNIHFVYTNTHAVASWAVWLISLNKGIWS